MGVPEAGLVLFLMMLVGLFVPVLLALPTALVANARGRSFLGWLIIGFFFPLLGLILVLVLPDVEEESFRRDREQREQRRLREQVAHERIRGEGFQQQVEARLEAHDRALGLDTRRAQELQAQEVQARDFHAQDIAVATREALPAGSGQNAGKASGLASPAVAVAAAERWHVSTDHRTSTELDLAELARRYRAGHVDDMSLVWCAGMPDWRAVADVPVLRQRLAART